MPNDLDQESLRGGPVGQKPRSYTYGSSREYRVDQGSGWLPRNFWRETVARKGFAYTFIPDQQERYSDEDIKQQNVRIARSVARYNGWLVIVGLAAAFISYFQWREIHDGSDDTHLLAKSAKAQAEAANKLASITRNSIELAQRAWVGPTGASVEAKPVAGNELKVTVNYLNTGKEPAFDLYSQSNYFITNEDGNVDSAKIFKNVSDCQSVDLIRGSQIVYPSTGFGGGNQMHITVKKEDINQDIVDGRKGIIIVGCFAYRTYEKTHYSAFCFGYSTKLTPFPNLNFCTNGAYAD